VGTALGSKGLPVVSISGDGSTLMSGQELTVAVTERLPIVFVILNDSSLGTVKHGQRLAGAEQVGFQLPPVDFSQMAAAMGARSHRIESPADFDNIDFDAICHLPGPTVLDVRIDPEEVPPMRVRMASLGTGCTE
jgi:acetolactate synthase-1/2/3 large subunit